MSFWDKIKFAKKPFKASDEKPVDGIVVAKEGKTAIAKAKPVAEPRAEQRTATTFSHVLVRPHVSEKAVMLAERGTYIFEVRSNSNASEVTNAVYAIYGIKPTRVRLMNMRSRTVRFGRTMGNTRAWKKAMVTVPTGKKLDMYG